VSDKPASPNQLLQPELNGQDPSLWCQFAVQRAELRYGLPSGLLLAISKVETGRPGPAHSLQPWPWTIQAEGRGIFFDSKAAAIQWTKEAMARGIRSIDAGCLQVNLFFHPDAFASLEEVFDPWANANYAARFLRQLYTDTGEWAQASGFYHSKVPARAAQYRQRLGSITDVKAISQRDTMLSRLRAAWQATFAIRGLEHDATATGDWKAGQLLQANIQHIWSMPIRPR
jgi:hypothetical protein